MGANSELLIMLKMNSTKVILFGIYQVIIQISFVKRNWRAAYRASKLSVTLQVKDT